MNVYVQTNEPQENRVLAFRRGDDGALDPLAAYATGGAGDGVRHLTSQGSVVLSGDGSRLLVTNAGSGSVSVFAIAAHGLELLSVAEAGAAPKSVAEHAGLVYVVNTGAPSLAGFRFEAGGLEALDGSGRELGEGSDPAQAGFTPDGSGLVVTDRGTDSIAFFPVGQDGRLGEPHLLPSAGPTPYGFAVTKGGTLVVTEAFRAEKGAAAASSYVLENGSAAAVSRSVGNGRSEICWAVVTADGRFAFATNFADGAVSRYAIGADGSLTLEDAAAGIAVEGATGLRDEGLSADGRFLYAIDADARRIFGWSVGENGELAPVGSWDGIPATVAGLAAS